MQPRAPRSVLAPVLALLLTLAALAGMPGSAPAAAAGAAPAYQVTTLHFKATVGPANDQVCDVIGDVYVPTTASKKRRVPAILTTNGFGGSKDDQAGFAKMMAKRGYVVLSYSGLGFGGSGCVVDIDNPDTDGKAGRALVSYLGGADGIAFTDAAHTQAAPRLQVVKRDRRGHDGRSSKHDPRVGMFGGSYGGGAQFATAAVDPRVDALVPMITWNDLSYSLDPNSTGQTSGVSTATPGAAKLWWALGFSLLGMTGDLTNQQLPPDLLPCPNFAAFVCPALVTAGATGFLMDNAIGELRHRSVASFMKKIRIPVLLMQGQNDTLFNLNEAVATYDALRRQGTPVKMVWHSWGHSGNTQRGEYDAAAPDPAVQYGARRTVRWFDHYLKDRKVGTGPRFAYFRDWVEYDGDAAPAYRSSAAYPVGTVEKYRLSGTGDLVTGKAEAGTQTMVTTAAGLPTGLNEIDVLSGFVDSPVKTITDLPGTSVAWSTRPLKRAIDVVGSPRLRLKVDAPLAEGTQALGPTGQLVLFIRIADVGRDGKARLIHNLEAPVRVADAGKPFTVRVPAIVHRFKKGHRLSVVVAGGSPNYRAGVTPTPVTIASGDKQVLRVPVIPR